MYDHIYWDSSRICISAYRQDMDIGTSARYFELLDTVVDVLAGCIAELDGAWYP